MESEQTVKITIDDILPKILDRYIEAEKEITDMHNFQRESMLTCDCNIKNTFQMIPSKALVRRYGLNVYNNRGRGFVWWLMEEYFKGNLILKKDVNE